MDTSPLHEAVRIAGGQAALARKLNLKQGHVWDWLNRNSGAPLEHCPAIEAETGVPCEQLRDDVTWLRTNDGRVSGYVVRIKAA
jgi:DNA-binding transcriptional regulator YdaS (Cro superfamily)